MLIGQVGKVHPEPVDRFGGIRNGGTNPVLLRRVVVDRFHVPYERRANARLAPSSSDQPVCFTLLRKNEH